MILESKVPEFEGKCKPTWLNYNLIDNRTDGGTSGFFKLAKKKFGIWWKYGKEFHGLVLWGTRIVESTEDDSV